MSKHIAIRIAWHDNKWNGSICSHPGKNTYCIHLPRINDNKNETFEEEHSGISWDSLQNDRLPPCQSEGGAFMNKNAYRRLFNHPYNQPNRKNIPHLALKPTEITIPPFTTFAVPFWWMLRSNQKDILSNYPGIQKDANPPFDSAWVYSNTTQEGLLNTFFDPIKEETSLAIFYLKGANPIDEDSKRLIAGIGTVKKKSCILKYDSKKEYTYPLWDRLITHGIRPDDAQSEGVLLPYHEYLQLPEDFKLNTIDGVKTKTDLINEIKLTLQETAGSQEAISKFTYGSSWIDDSIMLSLLGKLRSIVSRIKDHGIVSGYWDNNLLWIDKQIGKVKESMGPFPSFGNALIALGFQYGHSLEDDLRKGNHLGTKDNPWDVWEDIIFGHLTTGNTSYRGDLPQFRDVWLAESNERKELLYLLSRFELSDRQIKNWFDPLQRKKCGHMFSDAEILLNPYIIAEEDLGDNDHYPIAVETLDNGLFEDRAIQGDYSPVSPQLVESSIDQRRIRAIVTSLLKDAAINGDTIQSLTEITAMVNTLNMQRVITLPQNYLHANLEFFKERLPYIVSDTLDAFQLKHYFEAEAYLRKTLLARAKKVLPDLNEDWESLVKKTIHANDILFDQNNDRHIAALKDQVAALQKITGRKLSILHGPAGTGKTTVMGALFGSQSLKSEGVLLLAPTGKARVKLEKMAGKGSQALTIAQFLSKQKRFDWVRLKPKFTGQDKYKAEQNIVIDECSMLTVDDLYAVLQALDPAHVKRIILVGDPFQLPPIGAGRPFADICSYLESLKAVDMDYEASNALARLQEVVRTVSGNDSDTLTLASWYSGIKPTKNADDIFSRLGDNTRLNDLQLHCWKDEQDLYRLLNTSVVQVLNLSDDSDYHSLNTFIGISPDGIDTKKVEAFQLLTPVKAPFWGAFNLNRKFQQQFKSGKRLTVNIGDYKIGLFDKVIQTANEKIDGYPSGMEQQISNGQLGVVKGLNKGYANVVFSGIDNNDTYGYKGQGNNDTDKANLELAYAITIHKSQGSDFDYVFLILPKTGKLISRELIYTALTRAKKKLILLVEGDSPHWILNLSKPQYSVTSKRNSNLFQASVRDERNSVPYASGLIHKTKKEGLIVRSKSEVIIANMLIEKGLDFEYEREYESADGQKRIPDFTFMDAAGDIIILEHLGMMSIPTYKQDWEKKRLFYQQNGLVINQTLFTTTESPTEGIDSIEIEKIIDSIAELL